MHNFRVSLFALVALTSLALGIPQGVKADPQGSVVLARAGSTPLVIWDASPVVATITQNKTPENDALHSLEMQAAGIAVDKLGQNAKAASITVRVVYQRTGAVSPTYGSATFAGVENLFTLTVDQKDAQDMNKKDLSGANLPKGFKVTVTGKLPPQ